MSAVIEGKGGFRTWLNKRLPVDQFMADQLTGYYAPKNFNIWYFFGSLALLMFVMQIVTGIFVTMHFKPGEATAWDSVQYMVREVPYMWLIQPMHAVGASFFFIVVYLHMARGMLYGSYKAPRELLWVIGMLIYLALMAEAFMGYVLPNGNMSYWGAQVIVNIFGTIPVIGPDLVDWIRGDYGIGDATLTRFFSLHVVALPFVIALLVMLHLVALRQVGSNNPDGIEIKEKLGPGRQAARRHSVPSLLHAQGHRRRRPVPHVVRHRGVLRADLRRPVHGAAELRAGQSGVDARAHRAGVVLHALLRDPARRTRPETRCAAHGACRTGLPVPAVAGSREEQVDPLSRLVVEDPARRVLRHVPGADVAGPEARRWHLRAAGAHLHGAVLPRSSSSCRSCRRPTATARFRKE